MSREQQEFAVPNPYTNKHLGAVFEATFDNQPIDNLRDLRNLSGPCNESIPPLSMARFVSLSAQALRQKIREEAPADSTEQYDNIRNRLVAGTLDIFNDVQHHLSNLAASSSSGNSRQYNQEDGAANNALWLNGNGARIYFTPFKLFVVRMARLIEMPDGGAARVNHKTNEITVIPPKDSAMYKRVKILSAHAACLVFNGTVEISNIPVQRGGNQGRRPPGSRPSPQPRR